ncbi:MAG: WecB/TagA/CpsF family glycosyltransferase [Patescibacteria group bacterium]
MKIEILGIKIDQVNLPEALKLIKKWLTAEGQRQVVTINPEFVVAAQKDEVFRNILNNADLATCDGAGLVWAAKFLKQEKLERVTGVDLIEALLSCHPEEPGQMTGQRGDPTGLPPVSPSLGGRSLALPRNDIYKIYLLGGKEGAAKQVAEKYIGKVAGFDQGGPLLQCHPEAGEAGRGDPIENKCWQFENNNQVLEKINASEANILLVALPQVRQEKWIRDNLAKVPKIKVAIGVGGTFDFLSGQVRRAPLFLRRLGLEWLYRLIQEPRRLSRIYNATIKFGWLVVKKK